MNKATQEPLALLPKFQSLLCHLAVVSLLKFVYKHQSEVWAGKLDKDGRFLHLLGEQWRDWIWVELMFDSNPKLTLGGQVKRKQQAPLKTHQVTFPAREKKQWGSPKKFIPDSYRCEY